MENLYYGMPTDVITYDLKGSEIKRWNKKGGKTLLDTNYRIDRNGEPLPINSTIFN
jgi:1-phosphatidylinositol-3-phosphate 5-kinase